MEKLWKSKKIIGRVTETRIFDSNVKAVLLCWRKMKAVTQDRTGLRKVVCGLCAALGATRHKHRYITNRCRISPNMGSIFTQTGKGKSC